MTVEERIRQRHDRLRDLNLARAPSPLLGLMADLDADQRKVARRDALRASGLGEPESHAERVARMAALKASPPASRSPESAGAGTDDGRGAPLAPGPVTSPPPSSGRETLDPEHSLYLALLAEWDRLFRRGLR